MKKQGVQFEMFNWCTQLARGMSRRIKRCVTSAGAVGGLYPGEHRWGRHGGLVAVVGAAPHDDAAPGGPVHQAVRSRGVQWHLVVALRRGRRRPAPADGDGDGGPQGGGVAEQEGNRAGLSPGHLHPPARSLCSHCRRLRRRLLESYPIPIRYRYSFHYWATLRSLPYGPLLGYFYCKLRMEMMVPRATSLFVWKTV